MNKFIFAGALFVLVAGLLIIAQPSSVNFPAGRVLVRRFVQMQKLSGKAELHVRIFFMSSAHCEGNIPAGGCTTATCQQPTGGACIWPVRFAYPSRTLCCWRPIRQDAVNSEGNALFALVRILILLLCFLAFIAGDMEEIVLNNL